MVTGVEWIYAFCSHGAFCAGDVMVRLNETAVPVESFKRTLAWVMSRARRAPGRPLYMLIVNGPTCPAPEPEARAIASRYFEYMSHSVSVIEGDALHAAMTRSVVAGMTSASERRRSYEVVRTTEAGALSIAKGSGGAVDALGLRQLVEECRRELAAMG